MLFNTTECVNSDKCSKLSAPSAMTSSPFRSRCNSVCASIFHAQAYTPTVFLKHMLSPPQSPKALPFSSPPSSPTLTLCVIQSSQGDGYPSPRSAYALHFLKRLIRLIDCPPPRRWAPSADSVWGWWRRVCRNQVCIDIFIKWLFLLPPDRPCKRTNGSR